MLSSPISRRKVVVTGALASAALTPIGHALASEGSLDPSTYGASGDGLTDDADALQSAIDEAASTGLPLVLPSGLFAVSAALLVDSNASTEIEGSGIDDTMIAVDSPEEAALVLDADDGAGHVALRGLSLASEGGSSDGFVGERGLDLRGLASAEISDCAFCDAEGNVVVRIEGTVRITVG